MSTYTVINIFSPAFKHIRSCLDKKASLHSFRIAVNDKCQIDRKLWTRQAKLGLNKSELFHSTNQSCSINQRICRTNPFLVLGQVLLKRRVLVLLELDKTTATVQTAIDNLIGQTTKEHSFKYQFPIIAT